jgi:hypothetical protein
MANDRSPPPVQPYQNRIKRPAETAIGLSVEKRADSPGRWKTEKAGNGMDGLEGSFAQPGGSALPGCVAPRQVEDTTFELKTSQ